MKKVIYCCNDLKRDGIEVTGVYREIDKAFE